MLFLDLKNTEQPNHTLDCSWTIINLVYHFMEEKAVKFRWIQKNLEEQWQDSIFNKQLD